MFRTLLSALACAVIGATALPAPVSAQTMASEAALRRTIYVPRDKTLSFRLAQPAARIVIAQPDIAKVTATSDRSFYVQGMDFGSTNMLVYGSGGRLLEVIDIRVGFDADGLQQDLNSAFPGETIQVKNLGESLLLVGEVSHTGIQERAEAIAKRYAPDALITRLKVRTAQQVVLEVRVLEATRSALQDIGFSSLIENGSFSFAFGGGLIGGTAPAGSLFLRGGSGSTLINNAIQAAEEKGTIRTLARPNLVALSGEKATFHAGGEFPYPVPQRDNLVTLEFRKYGVELVFTPTVTDNGLIRLEVEPSVSQLDFTNSIRVNGFTVPGLIIRKTKTVVQLKDGQPLSVSGLFQRDYANSLRQIPGIGSIPILGTLTRSARWRKSETELIIIVVPRLTTAADSEAVANINSAPGMEPSTADFLFNGKALDKPLTSTDGR
jgi:pilus assembly protein CpaC